MMTRPISEWTDALRSGKYEQNVDCLRAPDYESDKDLFCVLGVLCDVADPQKWAKNHGVISTQLFYEDELNDSRLSMSVRESFGIAEAMPAVRLTQDQLNKHMTDNGHRVEGWVTGAIDRNGYDGWVRLDQLNDDHVPFDVLADIIDAHAADLAMISGTDQS